MAAEPTLINADAKRERATPEVEQIAVVADVAPCVNFASWQNSVPLLRSLEVCNRSAEFVGELRLELNTSPAITRAKVWIIDRIEPGGSVSLLERDVQLDPGYLNGLNEAERGIAEFRLYQHDRLLADASHDIRVLARDEWGGMQSMGELLAAFVMPNDPAVAKILKIAGTVLERHGHSPALDGYQSRDPRRAYLLVAAIWSAIASENLTYANPPRSFEQTGQKTRRPTTILGEGLGTCLDISLLFAAAIEAVGLNPIIALIEGHCFVGAWIVEKTLPRLIETDCSEIRKAIDCRELITFETTLVTQRPPARFEDAVAHARLATRESEERKFAAAVDIARARMAQIRPLASHDAQSQELEENEAGEPLPLPAAPNLGALAGEEVQEKPNTPAGRVDRWQRKLLDLSLRNRLLNYKSTKQTVPVLCPDVSALEDRLAAGTKLRVISLPDENPIGERDKQIHRERTALDLDIEFARQAVSRDELPCLLAGAELQTRLTTLYRKVQNDLSEGGSNTLYLAVGFLKWKQSRDDVKTYRAPLLLVPIKLIRRSALSPFYVALHEDEVRFNATLIQLLKKDFGRDISAFESGLPTDEHGIDVRRVLDRMRQEVRDIPGFEVVDEMSLSTFSFAKYLMWKDLVDRIDQLENNRVVRHLIRSPDKPFERGGCAPIPDPQEIDVRFEPKDICHPLPADSSQLAAVMAASEGHDFVLVGPPGTGKSQTIANVIAQCLASRKTVLFVAEKTAALEVVYRRLRQQGLGDCCIELHSNRAERRRFLDQLQASWEKNRKPKRNEWVTISNQLRIRRDQLNDYVSALHARHANGWNVFDALGIAVKDSAVHAPTLDWADSVQHDTAAYQSLVGRAGDMGVTFSAMDAKVSLSAVTIRDWSAAWEANLLANCDELRSAAASLKDSLSEFSSHLGLARKQDCSIPELEHLTQLARILESCAGFDLRIAFHKQFGKFRDAATQLRRAIALYHDARQKTAAVYDDDALDRLPRDDLDRRWRLAVAAFWPISWFAKRKVRKLLQSYASGGVADPAVDLQAVGVMKQQRTAIAENALAGQTAKWKGLDTDVDGLEAHLQQANDLRRAIVAVGEAHKKTNDLAKAIIPAINGTLKNLPVVDAASSFLRSSSRFLTALRELAESTGSALLAEKSPEILAETSAVAAYIQAHRSHLQRWTAWCDVKSRAINCGLGAFVTDLEAGRVKPDEVISRFKLAYARWWLPKAIDRSPVLRTFQRFKHEDAILDFAKLDDLARQTASLHAREAIAHELPPPDGVARQSELGLLRHQMGLKRPSKSIREVVAGMPEVFCKLAPCLLMSPLSIAQYLPAGQALFDVVVFDEASQITTWDAIGAIARGRQTIIVGDPKQLPPTNFFGRSDDDEENEELEDHEKDLESILDETQASGLPTLQLNWHYRSRHESLITFSNWHYYGNKLVTFPAAESVDRGVSLRYLPNARYDRGKSRTNRDEAEAIVQDAVQRMKRCLAMPEEERLTFGVVTFNSQQQSLLQDLFDQAQRDDPELVWYFAEERIEPTVVKNLENVQGDERDVMYFSITFGLDASGRVPLTFGALNRDGGERRLNVAITRARRQLIVYSSFKADQLNIDRSEKMGLRDLKNFLEYAEKGPLAILARTEGSVGDYESPFEEAVAHSLVAKGWQVVPQVGVSGFRVDLGIVHPDKPGAYLAGIECDGATYHRAAVARDRDKTRQQVLSNLGWSILRVWSPDWWYDPDSAVQRVHEELARLLDSARSEVLANGQ